MIMFWGAILRKGKNHKLSNDNTVVVHVSNAVVSPNFHGKVQLFAKVNNQEYTIANFIKNNFEQTNLDLFFSSEQDVEFGVRGDGQVHLMGYNQPPDHGNGHEQPKVQTIKPETKQKQQINDQNLNNKEDSEDSEQVINHQITEQKEVILLDDESDQLLSVDIDDIDLQEIDTDNHSEVAEVENVKKSIKPITKNGRWGIKKVKKRKRVKKQMKVRVSGGPGSAYHNKKDKQRPRILH